MSKPPSLPLPGTRKNSLEHLKILDWDPERLNIVLRINANNKIAIIAKHPRVRHIQTIVPRHNFGE
jgi:hypothetical protein